MSPIHPRSKNLYITDYRTYERLDAFISQNHDSVLGLISYSSVFIAELIKIYPNLKSITLKILYRLRILSKSPVISDMSASQEYYYDFFRRLYGYIVDIRIAASVFNVIPYIAKFFKLYNSPTKLRNNLNSYEKVVGFLKYVLLFNYQAYELFGFLTSHDFLDRAFISKFTLLKKHQEDKDYDKSDYLYVYSCKYWFLYNIVEFFDYNIVNRKRVDWHFLVDTLFSYHWSLKNGLLDRKQFAFIGFIHTFDKFRRLIN